MTNNTERFTIRLSKEDLALLQPEADKLMIPMSTYLRVFIRRAIENYGATANV